MNKKILILGGANYQLPVIREALKRGHHVVVCTNNRLDPGIEPADEYFDVSIADHEAVIELARAIRADFVVGYVSETAMHAASVVSKALGLHGGVTEHVLQTCARKDLFRNFQASKAFPHPKYIVASETDCNTVETDQLTCPLIVKPVDSCGSRGVSRIDAQEKLPAALQYALHHSSKKIVIIEEVVTVHNRQFTGDGFMLDGRLKFFSVGEHIFDNEISEVTACGSRWPAEISPDLNYKIWHMIEEQLSAIGYADGPFNVDLRTNGGCEVIIIEIAPRNGANYFPQLIQYCTGVDLVAAIYDRMESKTPEFIRTKSNVAASLILHSTQDGVLEKISIAPELEQWILQKEIYRQPGDTVRKFQHLGDSIGILNLGFESVTELNYVVENRERLINVVLETAVTEAGNF